MKALVVITSATYGNAFAIATDVTPTTVVASMCYRPPLGTPVTIFFQTVYEDGVDRFAFKAEVAGYCAPRGELMVVFRLGDFIDEYAAAAGIH